VEENNNKIITLTLSPAFDMHCTGEVVAKHENLITPVTCQAGGKGVNISRALNALGTANRALVLVGEENRQAYLRGLEKDGLEPVVFSTPGRIRENITVHSEDGSETRLCFPAFTAETGVWEQIGQYLLSEAGEGAFVTMTGRVPEGIKLSEVKKLLMKLAGKGVKTVIDSRSFSAGDLLEVKPWLIKPNREEISMYLNREVEGFSEVTEQAKAFFDAGIANVMVSMGGDGALLVCKEGTFLAKPPKVEVMSTIGAGDSTVAGFIAASSKGIDAAETLRTAVACGTAACLTAGTMPPEAEMVSKIRPKVQLSGVSGK